MEPSIRQTPLRAALPDFRNLGVVLRIVLGVNLFALLWVFARNRDFHLFLAELVQASAWVEPPLMLALPVLYLANSRLAGLSPRLGRAAAVGLAAAAVLVQYAAFSTVILGGVELTALGHALACTVLASLFMLAYFDYRTTLYSPALAEARLMALTARIRPHFLYNSLNAVLGVIRHDPRRAEAALEELSDLFRVLMRENRELVPLSDEIALARQYLELERLRLGERLKVDWRIDACPPDTLMPPLMLQPLLENAVYHGIEPAEAPSTITVELGVDGNRIRLRLCNPIHGHVNSHGNQMALANIRERLMLFYDLEARLDTREADGCYEVVVELPLRRERSQ